MKPTTQQQTFLDEIAHGTGNIALVARAGCGKTSTILMAVDQIHARPCSTEVLVCAFNKAIADEVRTKLEDRGHTDWRKVQSSTLHGLGFGLVRFAFSPKVDNNKVRDIVRTLNGPVTEYEAQVIKLVDLAKGEGFGFFPDRQIGDVGAWYRMMDHYDVNGFDDTSDSDMVVEAAQYVYRTSLADTKRVDFNDMILFPLVKNMRVRFQKDVVFVDEAQDLSRARQALARKFVKRSGRMIIVGDDRQAIYGFSGADADALTNLKKQLRATVVPLSVTWRCPKAVVALAQTIVHDIEAAPEAPEGRVEAISELPAALGPETAILCRNTAPLVAQAYSLLRDGTACKVEGKDIGEGLKLLLKRWKVKSVGAYLNKLDAWEDRETQKLVAKDKEDKIEALRDRAETVRVIAEATLAKGQNTVADMVAFVDGLFADDNKACLTLATYHRSKGREWPRVILLDHAARCPSPAARMSWQIVQEDNLAYVAFTRAQSELLFLGGGAHHG